MIERLGALVLDGIVRLGAFVLFLLNAVLYVFVPPYKPRLLIRQIRIIGADSLFLIVLIGGFTGMVLGLQGYNTLRRFGSDGALGTVVALVLVRELGSGAGRADDRGARGFRDGGRARLDAVHRADRRADA